MKSFTNLAALAALFAHAHAQSCVNNTVQIPDPDMNSAGTISSEVFNCDDDIDADLKMKIDDAVAKYAGGYEWSMLPMATGYQNNLFFFKADADGLPIFDDNNEVLQGTKGNILLVHSATRDCLSWLTMTQDETMDSIPKMLFDKGYNVFMACRRGTAYSRAHETFDLDTAEGYKDYFNFNTNTVGVEDIGRYVDAIMDANNISDSQFCTEMQIITHGYGAAEVAAGLANDGVAPAWSDKVSHVLNLSPCFVPTYLSNVADSNDSNHWRRRRLAAKQDPADAPRELQAILDEEKPKRQLWDNSWDSYWTRVEQYCHWYPSSCDTYCDWYPDYCDEFCMRFPQHCEDDETETIPAEIKTFYELQAAYVEAGVESLYGPNWADQVETVCANENVSSNTCESLRATVDAGYAEMSRTQVEHMYQQSYVRDFTKLQDADAFKADQNPDVMDVETLDTPMSNFFVSGNGTCDADVNMTVTGKMTGIENMVNPFVFGVTHGSIQGANNDYTLNVLLNHRLDEGFNAFGDGDICI